MTGMDADKGVGPEKWYLHREKQKEALKSQCNAAPC